MNLCPERLRLIGNRQRQPRHDHEIEDVTWDLQGSRQSDGPAGEGNGKGKEQQCDMSGPRREP